jgi:hypothetical protein
MASRTATKMEAVLDYATNTIKEATIGVHNETLMSVQDTSVNGPTVIYAGPCLLVGVYVNTVLSAHTVIFKDNTVDKITLPASLAAGSERTFHGARFETSLVIDPDDSSTGNLTVFYRPI